MTAGAQLGQDALVQAALRVIEMNRQHALDQYGDAEKAETWGCVTTLRAALATVQPSPAGQGDAWSIADLVRADLDRQSCPDAYMRIAVESVVKHLATREPVTVAAYRLLYLTHDGRWTTQGRLWADGAPDPKLLREAGGTNPRWRIEYAYTAPRAPSLQQQVNRYRIEGAPGLDPITVYTEHYLPGQGRLTVACYGSAWTAYWNAMGPGSTVEDFVASCHPEYVADNMVWGTDAKKSSELYANKVAAAVVQFFKQRRAVIDIQDERNA